MLKGFLCVNPSRTFLSSTCVAPTLFIDCFSTKCPRYVYVQPVNDCSRGTVVPYQHLVRRHYLCNPSLSLLCTVTLFLAASGAFLLFLFGSFCLFPGEREAEGGQGGANRPRQVLSPLHGVGLQAGDALQLRARDPEDKPGERGAAAQGAFAVETLVVVVDSPFDSLVDSPVGGVRTNLGNVVLQLKVRLL